jgi:hypothetical protein
MLNRFALKIQDLLPAATLTHQIGAPWIKPAADAQVSVNIDIKAGYVIEGPLIRRT